MVTKLLCEHELLFRLMGIRKNSNKFCNIAHLTDVQNKYIKN